MVIFRLQLLKQRYLDLTRYQVYSFRDGLRNVRTGAPHKIKLPISKNKESISEQASRKYALLYTKIDIEIV